MNDQIIDSIGKIDDDIIESVDALRQKKRSKPVWVKWAAIAACLCLVVVGGIIGHKLISTAQNDNTPSIIADAPPMVFVNDILYKQSPKQTSYPVLKEEFVYLGEIESEVSNYQSNTQDGLPHENFQSNHPLVGSKIFQYGKNIVVEINNRYWLFEPYVE